MFGFAFLAPLAMFVGNIFSLGTLWGEGNDWMLDLVKLTAASGLDFQKLDSANEWVYLGNLKTDNAETGFTIEKINKLVVINYQQTFLRIQEGGFAS